MKRSFKQQSVTKITQNAHPSVFAVAIAPVYPTVLAKKTGFVATNGIDGSPLTTGLFAASFTYSAATPIDTMTIQSESSQASRHNLCSALLLSNNTYRLGTQKGESPCSLHGRGLPLRRGDSVCLTNDAQNKKPKKNKQDK